jgi:HAD superfamily hydrolase (TIGR01549 family)
LVAKSVKKMFKENNIKVISFDFWSTLGYNIAKEGYTNIRDYIKTNLGEEYYRKTYWENITEEDCLRDFKNFVGYPQKKHFLSLLRKQEENISYYSNTVSVLEELKKHYKLAIVSNANFIGSEKVTSLGEYIDEIILSYKVGSVKPYKEIFDILLERINDNANFLQKVKIENILHIGDKYKMDYEGSKEFGMNALLLDRKEEYKDLEERIQSLKDLI